MLGSDQRRREREIEREVSPEDQSNWDEEIDRISRGSVCRSVSREQAPTLKNSKVRDTSGRQMPPSERAPVPNDS